MRALSGGVATAAPTDPLAPADDSFVVELSGIDVDGHDDPVCGTDAIKVHFSFFGEDSDRESALEEHRNEKSR